MIHYTNRERLVVFDADGTLINAFHAIEQTFLRHGMAIGDLERFQKRRKLLKYLGGLREFPTNLRQQFGKQSRKRLLNTLTEFYRHEACLYPGIDILLRRLLATPGIRVALVTRNITREPELTLQRLFERHEIDPGKFDHIACLPVNADKSGTMKQVRQQFGINPALAYACGDEYGDYLAAIRAGLCPFIVSYGMEDIQRLVGSFAVPEEVIATSPAEFIQRLLHALDLPFQAWPQDIAARAQDGLQAGM